MCRAEGQFALLLDVSFHLLWHTDTLTDILGYDTLVGHDATEHLHPDDVALVADLLARFSEQQADRGASGPAFRPDPSEIRLRTASGVWLTMEAATYDYTSDPSINGFLIICKLIVDRSDVGRAIELLGTGADVVEVLPVIARLADHALGTTSRCALAWWDNDQVRVAWSPNGPLPSPAMGEAARTALRHGVTDAITFTDFAHPTLLDAGADAARFGYSVAHLLPIVAPGGDEVVGCLLTWGHQTIELGLHPQMPLHICLRLAALAIMDGRIKAALRWTASHDPLTSLINRTEFGRQLAAMESDDVALLYVDLDDFKPINDRHGHSIGDAVLVEVAIRIHDAVGGVGVCGRLGGDEFAVACSGMRDVEVGWRLADRLVDVIRRPIRVGTLTVAVGASIGVAMGAQPLIPSILIQRADEALLAAKSAGKNMVKVAT